MALQIRSLWRLGPIIAFTPSILLQFFPRNSHYSMPNVYYWEIFVWDMVENSALHSNVMSRVLGQPATHPCRKFKELPPREYSLTFPDVSTSFVTWWCFYLRRGGETRKQRTLLESVPQVAVGCSNKTPFHNPRLQGCLWTLWLQFFAFILDLL